MKRFGKIFFWILVAVAAYGLGYITYQWVFPETISPVQQEPAPPLPN